MCLIFLEEKNCFLVFFINSFMDIKINIKISTNKMLNQKINKKIIGMLFQKELCSIFCAEIVFF